ncbi:MAG: rhomboid family intramembrane serine protease [Lachnospiraceae bacterium]|nr:rhomboid family intramembrane serine protease [Lachnospiraceae bacterium]
MVRNKLNTFGNANIIIASLCIIAFIINSIFVEESALLEISSDRATAYLLNILAGCQGVLGQIGALSYEAVFKEGQWWRIITHIYLHAGIVHLTLNMIALLIVGKVIERKIGSIQYAGMFHIYATISGVICCYVFRTLSVGASAGIFGMIGMLGMLYILKLKKDDECDRFLKKGEFIYLIAFTVLSNIGLETLVSHMISFVLGIATGYLACKADFF